MRRCGPCAALFSCRRDRDSEPPTITSDMVRAVSRIHTAFRFSGDAPAVGYSTVYPLSSKSCISFFHFSRPPFCFHIAEQNQIFLRICLNIYQKYSFQNSEVYTICIFFKENPPYLLTLPVKCAIIIWYTFRQCASRAMLPIRLTYKFILCGTAPAKQQQIPLCVFCRTAGFWKESILWITTKDETVLPPLTTESEPKKAGQAFRCGNITDRPVHRNIPITVRNWKKPLPSPNGSSFCGSQTPRNSIVFRFRSQFWIM